MCRTEHSMHCLCCCAVFTYFISGHLIQLWYLIGEKTVFLKIIHCMIFGHKNYKMPNSGKLLGPPINPFLFAYYRLSHLLSIIDLSSRCYYYLHYVDKEMGDVKRPRGLTFISVILHPLNNPVAGDIFVWQTEKLRLGEIKQIASSFKENTM